tara:strand:+ start:13 stop:186 length:174 start_codon:yes stop_codon:yes gene_type:complete
VEYPQQVSHLPQYVNPTKNKLILIDVGNKKPMISVIPKFNKIIGRVPTTNTPTPSIP